MRKHPRAGGRTRVTVRDYSDLPGRVKSRDSTLGTPDGLRTDRECKFAGYCHVSSAIRCSCALGRDDNSAPGPIRRRKCVCQLTSRPMWARGTATPRLDAYTDNTHFGTHHIHEIHIMAINWNQPQPAPRALWGLVHVNFPQTRFLGIYNPRNV